MVESGGKLMFSLSIQVYNLPLEGIYKDAYSYISFFPSVAFVFSSPPLQKPEIEFVELTGVWR